MPAKRSNLAVCDNCKRPLATLVVQEERLQFCAVFCADEHCAKRHELGTTEDEQEVLDRARAYLAAVISGMGVGPANQALILAASICWRVKPPADAEEPKAATEEPQSQALQFPVVE